MWARAKARCEYCRFDAASISAPFEIDHILAIKHGGQTVSENLALACFQSNSFKGPNLAGIDPESGRVTRLFHPRRDRWSKHFEWDGATLVGLTSVGRATIEVLRINLQETVELRQALIDGGTFPPRG